MPFLLVIIYNWDDLINPCPEVLLGWGKVVILVVNCIWSIVSHELLCDEINGQMALDEEFDDPNCCQIINEGFPICGSCGTCTEKLYLCP